MVRSSVGEQRRRERTYSYPSSKLQCRWTGSRAGGTANRCVAAAQQVQPFQPQIGKPPPFTIAHHRRMKCRHSGAMKQYASLFHGSFLISNEPRTGNVHTRITNVAATATKGDRSPAK